MSALYTALEYVFLLPNGQFAVGKVLSANAYFRDIECVLFDSGIEVESVRDEHVQGSEVVGLGVGVYQPGVCVPLKALFLVWLRF